MDRPIFTYFLGAGASFNVLPLVKSFPDRFDKFRLFVKTKFPESLQQEKRITFKVANPKGQIQEDIKNLIGEIKNHASIDTYARKLYLTREYEILNKLKALLDLYLTIEQFSNGIDPRYDAFLATILQEDGMEIKIPNNIRVITWNYDIQIELSLANFLQITDSKQLDNIIKILPSINDKPFELDIFSLIKLNGTSMGYIQNNNKFGKMGFDPTKLKDEFLNWRLIDPLQGLFFDYFNKVYLSYPDAKKESTILYSWEENEITRESRNRAAEIMGITDYLIIIGYSFPTFNRSIDRTLLQSLKKTSKVFIQAPESDIGSVVQKFVALSNNEFPINSVTQTDEFHIPFEYK